MGFRIVIKLVKKIINVTNQIFPSYLYPAILLEIFFF